MLDKVKLLFIKTQRNLYQIEPFHLNLNFAIVFVLPAEINLVISSANLITAFILF